MGTAAEPAGHGVALPNGPDVSPTTCRRFTYHKHGLRLRIALSHELWTEVATASRMSHRFSNLAALNKHQHTNAVVQPNVESPLGGTRDARYDVDLVVWRVGTKNTYLVPIGRSVFGEYQTTARAPRWSSQGLVERS